MCNLLFVILIPYAFFFLVSFSATKIQTQCVPLTHCIFFYPLFLSFFISLCIYMLLSFVPTATTFTTIYFIIYCGTIYVIYYIIDQQSKKSKHLFVVAAASTQQFFLRRAENNLRRHTSAKLVHLATTTTQRHKQPRQRSFRAPKR